jgi:hypothetical protein
MLYGGLNVVSGNGLTSYDGSFLVLWPPLYPVLLGIMHRVTGWEMLAAAGALQAGAFLGIGLCSALLFLRIFPANFGLAALATVAADIGSVMLVGLGQVGSDYVHLLLVVLFVLLSGQYLSTSSGRIFLMMAIVGMFAALTRYLGMAAIASGAASILLLARGSLRRRVAHSVVLYATAVPSVIWLAITSPFYTRRDPITFSENFHWFSRSILEWLFAPETVDSGLNHNVTSLWVIVLLLLAIVLMLFKCQGTRRRPTPEDMDLLQTPAPALFLYPLLLYGLLYALTLFGSASLTFFNKLSGRFLLPMYLPLIILPIAAAGGILRWIQYKTSRAVRGLISGGLVLGLLTLTTLLLRITYPLVLESHANGAAGGANSLNTRAWRENSAVAYWLSHVPSGGYLLLSNEPDGAAFHTGDAAKPSPRKAGGPYGTEEWPLSDYSRQLFASGIEVYLLWLEPSPYDHYYTPEELTAIAEVEPLIVSEAGGVYRLKPRLAR